MITVKGIKCNTLRHFESLVPENERVKVLWDKLNRSATEFALGGKFYTSVDQMIMDCGIEHHTRRFNSLLRQHDGNIKAAYNELMTYITSSRFGKLQHVDGNEWVCDCGEHVTLYRSQAFVKKACSARCFNKT